MHANNKTKYNIHNIMRQNLRRDQLYTGHSGHQTGHSLYTSRYHFSHTHNVIDNILLYTLIRHVLYSSVIQEHTLVTEVVTSNIKIVILSLIILNINNNNMG